MGKLIAWLSANWVSVFAVLGGMSGYASVWLAIRERKRTERRAMEARLKLTTMRAEGGVLRVALTFDPPHRSEPFVASVKVIAPRAALAAYNGAVAMVSDGQGGFAPAGPSRLMISREIEFPLHQGRSPVAEAAFFVGSKADAEDKLDPIDWAELEIAVRTSASRRRLLSIKSPISAI